MKKTLVVLFIVLFSIPSLLFAEEKTFTIIHSNDLHSHLLGFAPTLDYTPNKTGDDDMLGGWARIATVIKDAKKERKNPTLVLDGGDFLMGTLFHMVSREYSFELRLMKEMGYDAVTLGNHEFDLMPKGLARIIQSGHDKGGIPQIVSSNLIFSKESKKDDSLEKVYKSGLIKSHHVIERDGIKFGFFGLIGKGAAEVAPFASPVKFDDQIKVSKAMVDILRNKEKVDVVICISHSGICEDKTRSEDEILAKEVRGIDVIISGHSHTKTEGAINVNDTIIVQAWEYGKEIGIMDLSLKDGKVKLKKYEQIAINDTIKGDRAITGKIN